MSLIYKIIKILRSRPTKVFAYARQYWMFYQTYWLAHFTLKKNVQITLHPNVRLQRLSSILVEKNASLELGKDSIIYENAKIEAYGNGRIVLGAGSIIGDARIQSRNNIIIGKKFLTSWNVYICDFDPHPVDSKLRSIQMQQMVHQFSPSFEITEEKVDFVSSSASELSVGYSSSEIIIGDNVWVGANVSILKGAKIGDNCILATGAVVLKGNYPNNSLIAGNPAKVIKSLD